MARNLYLAVILSVGATVAILVGASAWKLYITAFRPLLQVLGG